MMSDEEAFIAIIMEDPSDRLARGVFADWLDEHDRPLDAYIQRYPPLVTVINPGYSPSVLAGGGFVPVFGFRGSFNSPEIDGVEVLPGSVVRNLIFFDETRQRYVCIARSIVTAVWHEMVFGNFLSTIQVQSDCEALWPNIYKPTLREK